jgi:hypothetical protein
VRRTRAATGIASAGRDFAAAQPKAGFGLLDDWLNNGSM